jgi:hypothetical protein
MTTPRLALLEVLGRDGRIAQTVHVQAWPLSLGRSLAADVVLDDPFVAPLHATLDLSDTGELTLQVGDSDNGVVQGRQLHSRGQTVPVPRGGATWHIGGLQVRLRTLEETLAAEQALPRHGRHGVWMPVLMLALLMLLAMASHWVSLDPGASLMDWLPLLAGLPVALGLWAGVWALASKLFQHRFEFMAHLRLVLPVALAVEAVELLMPLLAAALGWPWLWRLAEPLQWLALGWLVFRHLVLVLPQSRRAVAAFVGAAGLAASAVVVAANVKSVDRWSRPPYMSTLPLPSTVWTPTEPAAALVQDLGPLAERLSRRVEKARAEEPSDTPDEGSADE